jgi:hypothetical protein
MGELRELTARLSGTVALAGMLVLILPAVLRSARFIVRERRRREFFARRVSVPPFPCKQPAGARAERRRYPRRAGYPVTVHLFDDAETGLGEGRVVDRSVGGIGLESGRPFRPGARVLIVPFGLRHKVTPVAVEVRNSRRRGDVWRSGCAFVRPPSWASVMHLR